MVSDEEIDLACSDEDDQVQHAKHNPTNNVSCDTHVGQKILYTYIIIITEVSGWGNNIQIWTSHTLSWS